ncbi:hypothetical protein [Streptomyces sp. NBC_00080]|uniref:hypothetical protein n=1 Tax=Streptomyces sp. NBC_00080 TaxID=2975645 RepID=UPI00386C1943
MEHDTERLRLLTLDEGLVSVTVSVWLTRSRAATGSDTSFGGRRPRSSGHSAATRPP